MKNRNKKYTKGAGKRELLPVKSIVESKEEIEIKETRKFEKGHINYTKPEAYQTPRVFIAIISGGEKREKDYFKILFYEDKFTRLKLNFIADPSKLNPKGMLEIADAMNARFKESKGEEDEPDEIYLVSDVDLYLEELQEIKPKCDDSGYGLIISNPCFEIWLYYAVCKNKPAFAPPAKTSKISGKFQGWVNHAIPGGVKPNKAIFQIQENIKNAKSNYDELEPGIPALLSTNMFLLAEKLILFIEPELKEWIKRNKEIERMYRNRKQ